jgi:hypothetical protein
VLFSGLNELGALQSLPPYLKRAEKDYKTAAAHVELESKNKI